MTNLPAAVPGCNSGRPVRRPRLRPSVPLPPASAATSFPPASCQHCNCTPPIPDGFVPISAGADDAARYELLVRSRANRLGHKVIEAAQQLNQLLDQFQRVADPSELYRAFRAAGLAPDGTGQAEEFGESYFEDAAGDALGFAWSIDVFIDLFRGGLVRHPNSLPAMQTPRRS